MGIAREEYSKSATDLVLKMTEQIERPQVVLYVGISKDQELPDRVEITRGDLTITYWPHK